MIYALMVGEYDSRDVHSAYTDEEVAKAAGALIEEHSGLGWEVIPITFNMVPDDESLWSVIVKDGKVIECKMVVINERWHQVHFAEGRLRVVTLARTLEEAIKIALDQWEMIHSYSDLDIDPTVT